MPVLVYSTSINYDTSKQGECGTQRAKKRKYITKLCFDKRSNFRIFQRTPAGCRDRPGAYWEKLERCRHSVAAKGPALR